MDLDSLRNILETKLGMKVVLRYKSIFRGRQILKVEGEKLIQAIYIKLCQTNFKKNFNNIIAIHRRKVSGFDDGRKIRFFQI